MNKKPQQRHDTGEYVAKNVTKIQAEKRQKRKRKTSVEMEILHSEYHLGISASIKR